MTVLAVAFVFVVQLYDTRDVLALQLEHRVHMLLHQGWHDVLIIRNLIYGVRTAASVTRQIRHLPFLNPTEKLVERFPWEFRICAWEFGEIDPNTQTSLSENLMEVFPPDSPLD